MLFVFVILFSHAIFPVCFKIFSVMKYVLFKFVGTVNLLKRVLFFRVVLGILRAIFFLISERASKPEVQGVT